MKRTLIYIMSLLILAGCSESEFDSSRTPSFMKCYLRAGASELNFPSSASSKSLSVESDETPWTISVPSTWVKANQTKGNNSATVDFSVELNNSADTSRVCIANLSSDTQDWKRSIPITLSQAKATAYINLSPSSLVVDGKAQQQIVRLSTNVKYNITHTADWIKIDKHDNEVLVLSISENTTGNARSGQITLYTSGLTVSLSVTQRAANISSTTQALNFSYVASSANVSIESEAAWSAVSSDWIELSPTSGKAGTATMTVSVPKNASVNTRTGFVYLTIDGKNKVEIPVVQTGITCNVSTNDLHFDSFAGSKTWNVTSNDSWRITSYPEWLTLDCTSGTGNATIKASVKENNTTTPLNGKIILSTTDNIVTHTINVSQDAKTIDFNLPTLLFSYMADSQKFSFTTDGNWSMASDADWFTIDKSSGSGDATITVSVTENMSAEERLGTITLNIVDQSYIINVHQECKYLTLSSTAFELDSKAGYVKTSIASNTQWRASVKNRVNWLAVTPSSGNGNADITIGVGENNTPNERTGVIQVEIPDVKTYLLNITQKGKYIRVDRSSIDFTSNGGTITLNVTTDGTYEVSRTGNWFGYTKSGDAIIITAMNNTTGSERNGTITLKLTNLSEGSYELTIPVKQSATSSKQTNNCKLKIKTK